MENAGWEGVHRWNASVLQMFCYRFYGPLWSIYMSQVAVSVLLLFVLSLLRGILVTEMSNKIS
jgi:hypothetical protein